MTWSAAAATQSIGDTFKSSWKSWAWLTLAIAVAYYLILLVSMVLRFGNVPNYVTFYDWPGNVWTIIRSTPSVSDMLPIILEEWLVEIGYMNYSFGNGISEWSLSLQPPKMLQVLLFSALVAMNILLLLRTRKSCPAGAMQSASVATGLGTFLAGLTNVTMTWVVCCATPSWIVGLTMLGLGVSTSAMLEPYGIWVSLAGYGMLALTTLFIAGMGQGERTHRKSYQDLEVAR